MHIQTPTLRLLLFRSLAVLLALGLPVAALAQNSANQNAPSQNAPVQNRPVQAAQARPAPSLSASSLWSRAGLQAATYVVLAPSLEGNPAALSADQQKSVLSAMQRDLQGAMLRRYPGAKFVTDAGATGVISLRPVLVVPTSLLPWNYFQARVELSHSAGQAVIRDNFGVLEVYGHQSDAANYLFDQLVKKLP
ncbi:hypothetical protein [Deinococcus sp.]|uniref:hypothetical protein n=1 Tax=Deinococcus sp. TaxID=47478 RepID=UPI00286DA24F|nr:hypothetical protein [Deinococcus sp.]